MAIDTCSEDFFQSDRHFIGILFSSTHVLDCTSVLVNGENGQKSSILYANLYAKMSCMLRGVLPSKLWVTDLTSMRRDKTKYHLSATVGDASYGIGKALSN